MINRLFFGLVYKSINEAHGKKEGEGVPGFQTPRASSRYLSFFKDCTSLKPSCDLSIVFVSAEILKHFGIDKRVPQQPSFVKNAVTWNSTDSKGTGEKKREDRRLFVS